MDNYKINKEISAKSVRVVGDNIESKVLSLYDALKLSKELNLDLIEISPKADPPVCKIADYQKFLYQQKRKQKELRSKQTQIVVKEIRLSPQIGEHDLNTKINQAKQFILKNNKIKATVLFKGRSLYRPEQGEIILLKFANLLEDIAKVESLPKLMNRTMTIVLSKK